MGNNFLVLATDFGLKDRFVANMKGVAYSLAPSLNIIDLTHQITPFDILGASDILAGTIPFWPEGTIFVSVVDPGVGTSRKPIAALTKTGHIIITPNNGTLTYVAEHIGIEAVRIIDEKLHRREDSEQFHTFHGRDLFVHLGAKLASNKTQFDKVGPLLPKIELVTLPTPIAKYSDHAIEGNIMRIESPFGNLVTNIHTSMFNNAGWNYEGQVLDTSIWSGEVELFRRKIPFCKSFGYVEKGAPLIYEDSVGKIGLALREADFSILLEDFSLTNNILIFSEK
ncbi:SAM-dependent chlorinase/fluorinase [Flammeovirgaceae bacterium SG7u.111]|nr:SAM-dependent chlorinase/fluorinase [Flammeovirgaceae bacterium SG7u.132]WPO36208.1 SAM-dependent chlorinase/fluorinase [Flammeovirgaceae bacterium SG7u.111]